MLGCRSKSRDESATRQEVAPVGSLELVFAYGSEKQSWVELVTKEFNAADHKSGSGNPIFVRAVPMGSGETVEGILDGSRQAHLISPASEAFIRLGNADSQARAGRNLVGKTENLVLSPVVIAMWKPMAEALGWGKRPIGWKEIHDLAGNPEGWSSLGFPQWGQFRFGHTHPEFSNSGLISIFAEVYAGAGKVRGLTMADLADPKVGDYLESIEHSVVHYGSSTGFFGRKMFANGPEYLSASVLYENMVIESRAEKDLAFPLVAIYPKEGTFWSDHPIGIVDRDYVTDEHREAAGQYIRFLTDRPQQERAMQFGFRPGDVSLPLASPIDVAHGVDPAEPQTTLEVPEVAVMKGALDLWKARKKKSNVLLVLDTSGSMRAENKMENAIDGSRQLIGILGAEDSFTFIPFNDKVSVAEKVPAIGPERARLQAYASSLFASGGTALYDAVLSAQESLTKYPSPDRINAIVVLSDGADESSVSTGLEQLIRSISTTDEKDAGARVFTIGYGSGANSEVLEKIATASKGKYFKGTPENIREVFREISTFF